MMLSGLIADMSNRLVLLSSERNRIFELALSGLKPLNVSQTGSVGFRNPLLVRRSKEILRYGVSLGSLIGELKSLRPDVLVMSERDDTRNILPTLFRELPNTRFISVQSAWYFESAHLHLWWPGERNRLTILAWGQYMIDLAAKQGRDIRGRLAAGSLEASIFSDFFAVSPTEIRDNQICLIVKRKFGREGSQPTNVSLQRQLNVESVVRLTAGYCRIVGMRAVIPVDKRRDSKQREADEAWLDGLGVGDCIGFSQDCGTLQTTLPHWWSVNGDTTPPEPEEFRALAVASTSALVIGVPNSAVIWQSIALGLPVLAAGFGDHPFFDFPAPGPWKITNATSTEFFARAEQLRMLPNHRFSREQVSESQYFIDQSPSNRTVLTLRKLVREGQ